MSWRCRECGRTYDHPPGSCSCGSSAVEPDDGDRQSRYSLVAVRKRLLEPDAADRSLVSDDDRLTLVFRALLVVSIVLTVIALVALLV